MVADALSRNVPVSAVSQVSPVENFSLEELGAEQRKHETWGKVIYALESGDLSTLPSLHVPFSQFFLSSDNVLCRQAQKGEGCKNLLVIPEVLVSVVLQLVHDHPTSGHPGRDKTLAAARACVLLASHEG